MGYKRNRNHFNLAAFETISPHLATSRPAKGRGIISRDEWSVHFNVSPDGKPFCGDGGGAGMVAHAEYGKWLYLFRPELLADRFEGSIDTSNLIQTGVFHSERLVNMARHDYALEPNAMFSPDMKWLIFRSNLSGSNQVYAVELKKTDGK